jgi:hypothetical protein
MRKNFVALRDGGPPIPEDISEFQKRRLLRCLHIANLYLRKGKSSAEIGKMEDLTHQRVVQLLQFAIKHLWRTGWLRKRKVFELPAAVEPDLPTGRLPDQDSVLS